MPLVIAKSICRREFGSEEVPPQFMDTLQRSMSVDLATAIKGSNLPKATKLLKVYATSPEGAMRIVHLMATEDGPDPFEETLFTCFLFNVFFLHLHPPWSFDLPGPIFIHLKRILKYHDNGWMQGDVIIHCVLSSSQRV